MVDKLLKILLVILEWFGRQERKKQAKQKQADYDAIQKDPINWANNHFNGVRDSAKVPDDADKARETDSNDKAD